MSWWAYFYLVVIAVAAAIPSVVGALLDRRREPRSKLVVYGPSGSIEVKARVDFTRGKMVVHGVARCPIDVDDLERVSLIGPDGEIVYDSEWNHPRVWVAPKAKVRLRDWTVFTDG